MIAVGVCPVFATVSEEIDDCQEWFTSLVFNTLPSCVCNQLLLLQQCHMLVLFEQVKMLLFGTKCSFVISTNTKKIFMQLVSCKLQN